MSDIVSANLTDLDPEGQLATHWWRLGLEFSAFQRGEEEIYGGTYTLDIEEFWARLLQAGLNKLTDQEVQSLLDQYWP